MKIFSILISLPKWCDSGKAHQICKENAILPMNWTLWNLSFQDLLCWDQYFKVKYSVSQLLLWLVQMEFSVRTSTWKWNILSEGCYCCLVICNNNSFETEHFTFKYWSWNSQHMMKGSTKMCKILFPIMKVLEYWKTFLKALNVMKSLNICIMKTFSILISLPKWCDSVKAHQICRENAILPMNWTLWNLSFQDPLCWDQYFKVKYSVSKLLLLLGHMQQLWDRIFHFQVLVLKGNSIQTSNNNNFEIEYFILFHNA